MPADTGPVAAVLFDLDDTLFDHAHCADAALRSIHAAHAPSCRLPFDEFAGAHSALLEELHAEVMLGRLDVDAARAERFRRLFERAGLPADEDTIRHATACYRQGYLGARRSVAGAAALLERVRERARVGIVSNNLLVEQQQKLRHCGLERFVDALVVSEEVGVAKPAPDIFRVALERLACPAAHAVMLGDSWSADIAGARAAGIRAIWFNRSGAPPPAGAEDVVEIRSFEPIDRVLGIIFDEPPAEAYANRR